MFYHICACYVLWWLECVGVPSEKCCTRCVQKKVLPQSKQDLNVMCVYISRIC